MQKGGSNLNALLLTLVIAVVGWMIWYHSAYGPIDFKRLLEF